MIAMYAEEIKTFFKGEVLDDDETLAKYSRDASIFEVRPRVVVCPRDRDDLKALVKWAAARKRAGEDVSLTARSGGTDMSGGAVNDSIIVDFSKHLNRFISLEADADKRGGSATVEPGMFYRDFEKETLKENLLMPSYPASREICTVGGMVANNSGGEDTLMYGKTEEYVTGLKVVLEDGEEYVVRPLKKDELERKMAENSMEGKLYSRLFKLIEDNEKIIKEAKPDVSKNSAGYYLWNVWDGETFDLPKLIVGSQGTLGLVTEITFRLVKKHRHSRLLVMFLRDQHNLAEMINEVLKFKPESFESYDDKTLGLAIRFFPEIMRRMKTNVFSLAFQFLPELFMLLRGGLPKMVLLVELAGEDENAIEKRLYELKEHLARFKVSVRVLRSEKESEKYWTIRRESFSLLRKHVRGKHTAPFIDDIIVKPEYLVEFLPAVNAILEPHRDKMIYTIQGHDGDGNFHIIPLMDFKDPDTRALILKVSEQIYDLVVKYKGSISAEHNDGLIRTPYLEKMYGSKVVGLFAEVKDIFDPLNLFNPRKKVNPDLDFALAHIQRS